MLIWLRLLPYIAVAGGMWFVVDRLVAEPLREDRARLEIALNLSQQVADQRQDAITKLQALNERNVSRLRAYAEIQRQIEGDTDANADPLGAAIEWLCRRNPDSCADSPGGAGGDAE